MKAHYFRMMLACVGWAAPLHAEQIRIVVVDAQHGKPVTDECLNISLGPWHGADLLASTNKDGVIILSLDKNQVLVEPGLGKTCSGMSSTKPFAVADLPTRISVLPDWYVSCQYSKKLTKDPAWVNASPSERIPSFAVQDILNNGVVVTNSCSKLQPTPKPGELVIVVRKRTLLEGIRS